MINFFRNLFGLGPRVDVGALVQQGALIVDVRTPGEYSSGHVKGSLNIPLDQLSGSLKKLQDKNAAIVTCCASGMRSAAARGVLRSAGYTNVHNGGSWQSVRNLKNNK